MSRKKLHEDETNFFSSIINEDGYVNGDDKRDDKDPSDLYYS